MSLSGTIFFQNEFGRLTKKPAKLQPGLPDGIVSNPKIPNLEKLWRALK
jgi:hypothetical protein